MRCLAITLFAGGVILFYSGSVCADEEKGRLKQDLTVGTSHDVQLKTDQVVRVLKHSGNTVVIMVQIPDGSSGIYQIAAADVELIAPNSAPAPPSSPIVATPANTNAPPTSTVASAPVAPTNAPPSPAPVTPATPPTYPNDFVGGPEFDTTAGKQAAGTASVIVLKGELQSYIISVRHLLGPDGGFEKQTAAQDVPAFVKSIEIESFSGGTHHYDVTGLLVPADQLEPIRGGPINDMAIYQNHDTTRLDQAVTLADEVPALGAPVWVVARVRGGVPEGQIMQSGKVTSNSTYIEIQFDNDGIITAGASGAPVLNADGKVIGVYSAHSNHDGHVWGFIIPAALIAKVIKQAATPAR